MHVLLEAVIRRLDQVGLVLIGAGVLLEGEQIARCDVARIALAVGGLARGLLLLDVDAGVVLAIGHLRIATRPFVDLPAVLGMAGRLLLLGVQQGLGLLKVVIVSSKMAGGHIFGKAPAIDEVFIVHVRSAVARVVRDGAGAIGQWAVRADVVGQHQGVVAVGVGEVVVDALGLHHARDEVEVALVVLHHVDPVAVAAAELVVDAEVVLCKHRLDDVWRFLVLEDLEVGAPGGMPELGAQHGHVTVEVAVPANVGELDDLPRKIALAAATFFSGQIDFDTHVLAEQALGGN